VIYRRYDYLTISVPHCPKCAATIRRQGRLYSAAIVAIVIVMVVVADKLGLGPWGVFALGLVLAAPFVLKGPSIFGGLPTGAELGDYNDRCIIFYFRSTRNACPTPAFHIHPTAPSGRACRAAPRPPRSQLDPCTPEGVGRTF
jgi:hypothetical protein